MVTPQASAFGFPNPLIGIVAFTVVVVTGVLAVAKVALPRWYWGGLAARHAARGRVHPLADLPEPLPHRRAVPVLHGGLGGHHPAVGRGRLDRAAATAGNAVARVLHQWRWSLVALWFTALILLILVRFWNYWSTLI